MNYDQITCAIRQVQDKSYILLVNREMLSILEQCLDRSSAPPEPFGLETLGGVRLQEHKDVNSMFPTLVSLTRDAYSRWLNASASCRWSWSAGVPHTTACFHGAEWATEVRGIDHVVNHVPEGLHIIVMPTSDG